MALEMGYNLHLEQSQKLIMTPQLQQAIKILQLTALELEAYIEQEMETNPVIEISEEAEIDKNTPDKADKVDWKEYVEDFDNYEYCKDAYHHNRDNDYNYENIIFKNPTLQEHLMFQYQLTHSDAACQHVCEFIINSLDDNGYLTMKIEEIAEILHEDVAVVEQGLRVVQSFDPVGVGARNLQECLALQCKADGISNSQVYRLINEFLDDLADCRYPVIARKMEISTKQVQDICDYLKTLEPKPGRIYASVDNRYVIPDVVIKKIDDEYYVIPNDRYTPRLVIRKDYKLMLTCEEQNAEAVTFLNEKLNSAMWLIKSIDQRMRTIRRVVETIVLKQRCFFEFGKKHLKPMTLKEIADEIGVHESTVSRATNGKYVETPMGTFELKYFFSSGVANGTIEGIASESIKNYIRELIDIENSHKPMSDDRIARELAEKGIQISRRTVAKYRDDMKIPASSKRKRY